MKKVIFILVFGVLCGACSDWLEVKPKTESPSKEMFESVSGFKDALTGVYLEMIDDRAYGEFLTMSKVEYLVNFWSYNLNSEEEAWTMHDFTDERVENTISLMYERLYKVIVAANSILEHIEDQKDIFSAGQYEAIKGECLGLRAFCHLDLLRLFGPVPGQAGDDLVLSYVTRVSKDLNPLLTFNSFKDKLFADIQDAKDLLVQFMDIHKKIDDDYFHFYNIRMNLYAVQALEARAYLWFGETDKAASCARNVIDVCENNEDYKFSLGNAGALTEKYYALPSEQIFALNRFDIKNKYDKLFGVKNLYKSSSANTINKVLFGNTGTDIRELYLWELLNGDNNGAIFYTIKKYKNRELKFLGDTELQDISLIRLSEMYLIMAETAPLQEAQSYWEKFQVSRNINITDLPADQDARSKMVLREYQKEFYAEGQVFYAYKRLNLSKDDKEWLWAPTKMENNYVLPLPKSEIINQ